MSKEKFVLIRFHADICENTRTTDELKPSLLGELMLDGVEPIKVQVLPKKISAKLRARRERIRRYLQEQCFQLDGNTFATKERNVEDIKAKVDEFINGEDGFLEVMDGVINDYNNILTQHLQSLPDHLSPIAEKLAWTKDQWLNRNIIGLKPAMYMSGLSEDDCRAIEEEIEEAGFSDIRRQSMDIYKNFLIENGKPKTEISASVKEKLQDMSIKAKSLSDVSQGMGNVGQCITELVASIAVDGKKIEGTSVTNVFNVVTLLSNVDTLKEVANGIIQVNLKSKDSLAWVDDNKNDVPNIDVAPAPEENPLSDIEFQEDFEF